MRDADGHRLVVRNGHLPEREILTGLGPLPVRQPRVNDKRIDEDGRRIRFTSEILPPYLRKTRSIEELIPWLYLKGISTGDFGEALAALLGIDAPGFTLRLCTFCAHENRSLRDPQGSGIIEVVSAASA